ELRLAVRYVSAGPLDRSRLHVPSNAQENRGSASTLGVVELNLAEYVRRGEFTRRFLLQESKVNASLKLSIDMRQLGESAHYEACLPPVPHGVAALLIPRVHRSCADLRFARACTWPA